MFFFEGKLPARIWINRVDDRTDWGTCEFCSSSVEVTVSFDGLFLQSDSFLCVACMIYELGDNAGCGIEIREMAKGWEQEEREREQARLDHLKQT